jgi:hypothetical protein
MPPHQAGSGGAGDRVPLGWPGGLPSRCGVVAALGTQELPQQPPPAMGIGASRRQPQVPRQDPAAGYPLWQIQPHDQVSALKPHGGTRHEDAFDDPPRAARAFPRARTADPGTNPQADHKINPSWVTLGAGHWLEDQSTGRCPAQIA